MAWYRGERLGCRELGRLQRIAGRCAGQTRAQMAEQVCRRFQWRRPGGEWSVVHQDDYGKRFLIKLNVIPVIPNLIGGPLF